MKKRGNWQVKSSNIGYQNAWITVQHHEVIDPSGEEGIYGVVEFQNIAVGIVPIDEEDNIWLVGQHRFPHDKYSWEIPEGGAPKGESPLDSAKRELLEETGIKATSWTPFIQMDLSNSVSNESGLVYLAENLSFHTSAPESTEELEIRKLPFEEAYQMVLTSEIRDSMSVAAILKLKLLRSNKI